MLLFHSFVGAVYMQHGLQVVLNWVGQLVDENYRPVSDQSHASSSPPPRQNRPQPPTKRRMYEPFTVPKYEPVEPSLPPPPQPPPPQMPPMSPMPTASFMQPPPAFFQFNPITPAQPTAAFLPAFNQLAAQRKHSIEWQAASTGPSHAPSWSVTCLGENISLQSSRSRVRVVVAGQCLVRAPSHL